MISKTFTLPRGTLEDQVAALLYALKQIPENQIIKKIDFGPMGKDPADMVDLQVTVEVEKEVLHINHNVD